jgi:hypothetical protein
MGVFTYQKKFDEATAKNNKEETNKNFNNLKAFTENHKAKLAAYKSLKPGQMAVVNKQGNWIVANIPQTSTKESAVEFAKNKGGFAYVGPNPKNLISDIENEVSIMGPVLAKMALELGKKVKPKETASVSQTVETKQAKEERQEVSKPTIVDKRTESVSTGKTQVNPAKAINPLFSTKNQYTSKDQKKSDKATKFIGKGAAGSSTAEYEKAWGNLANSGEYNQTDVVFVSTNGNRPNRVLAQIAELSKAIKAKATVLTDTYEDRQKGFNVGEREVSAFLSENNYVEENGTGIWGPKLEEVTPVTVSTENEKLINETETELSQDQTESVAEATTQSESKTVSDDTARDGAGVNTDSNKLNEQEPTIVEDKKYTSKQEILKSITKKKEAFVNFIECL